MPKHVKKKKNFNRALAFATAMAILVVASVSATIAFLVVGTDSIKNVFVPSEVKTEVVWLDNSATEDTGKNARIKNSGDVNAYIRAAVTVNWVKETKDADGNITRHIYSKAPVGCHATASDEVKAKCDYTIVHNGVYDNQTWLKKEYDNGEVIYYFKAPVNAGDKTTNLLSQFKQISTVNQPEGYELVVEIVASGIQSTPTNVVEEQWGVTITNGNITAVN